MRPLLLPFIALAAPAVLAGQQVVAPAGAHVESRSARSARVRGDMARADSLALSPRASLLAISRGPDGTLAVDVFVRAARGVEAALRGRGVRVGTRAGEWVTARVPLARLREIRAIPGVRGIEPARRATYSIDVPTADVADIHADAIRMRSGGDRYQGSAGRGAIVGVVDGGIDFRHPDFLEDDSGRSRILYLWDQSLPGSGPGNVDGATFTYGVECSQNELGALGSCPSADVEGHGTHVAGLAAGDGSGATAGHQDFAYSGVAPAADLIVVRTDFSFTSIVDGVDYIFRRAAELGRPAVVNLSLGTQAGPHDGNSAADLALDALTGPGKVIVAAAGNEGNAENVPGISFTGQLHAEGSAATGQTAAIQLQVPQYTPQAGAGSDRVAVQSFFSPLDSFTVAVTRPNGTTVTATSGQVVSSNDASGGVVIYNGSAAGDSVLGTDLEFGSFSPASSTNVAEIFLGEWVNGGATVSPGTWQIAFTRVSGSGPGAVDAYIPVNTLSTDVYFALGGTNRRLIGPPADARRVIAVGAYATLDDWRSLDGHRYHFLDSVRVGDVLEFTSPGPTRDGRLKPELAAPGRVFSTLSRTSPFATRPEWRPLVAVDGMHVMLQGTSMSSPHVAGAVALLLAEQPTLTPAQVLAALEQGARQDVFTAHSYAGDAGTPNRTWGFGKLTADASLARITPGTGRALLGAAAPLDSALPSSKRGTPIPLESVRLSATDPESLTVTRLGAMVSGADPGARFGVVVDADHDGVLGPQERPLAVSDSAPLNGTRYMQVTLPSRALIVPRGGSADLILVEVSSGAVRNGTPFSASLVPDSGSTTGLRTGTVLALNGAAPGSPTVRSTLLAAGEHMNMSENPVRGAAPLIINTDEPPKRLDVYDFAGRLVKHFDRTALTDARSIRWNLESDDHQAIRNGAYVLVCELSSGVERRKFFVVR